MRAERRRARRRRRKRRLLRARGAKKMEPLMPRYCRCCSSATEEEGGRPGLPPRGPEPRSVERKRKERKRESEKKKVEFFPFSLFPRITCQKLFLLSKCSPGASPLGARIREEERGVLHAQRDPIEERLERERTARMEETWRRKCVAELNFRNVEAKNQFPSHFFSFSLSPSLACRCISTCTRDAGTSSGEVRQHRNRELSLSSYLAQSAGGPPPLKGGIFSVRRRRVSNKS